MVSGKKILITGGAGFIGLHIAERLATAGNELTLLDLELNGPLRYSPLATDPTVRRIAADVRDTEPLGAEIARADLVLHFASLVGVQYVIDHARETIDTILLGTRNVLEAARKNDHLDRLVYISTSEVYGNALDATEGVAASVGTKNDPRLSYASAKLMGEHMVWAYHREFAMPTVIVRPFNVFGPKRKTANAVGIFAVRALAGQSIQLHGDGSQLRSWCYIDDFTDGMMRCLSSPAAVGQDFNIGNPVTATTIYDLAERTIRLAGSSSTLSRTAYTFSDIGARAPNSNKARELLGFEPKVDLDPGLIKTLDWHRQHLDDFRHWL